ncbi:unnamed protein product [Brassica oleracea var. botrytis]
MKHHRAACTTSPQPVYIHLHDITGVAFPRINSS